MTVDEIEQPDAAPAATEAVAASLEVYRAFISYRNRDGAKAACWLRERLIAFSIPKGLAARLGLKSTRLQPNDIYLYSSFQKAGNDFYQPAVKRALLASEWLLFVVSPSSEEPLADGSDNWSIREARDFLEQRSNVTVLFSQRGLRIPPVIEHRFPNVQRGDLSDLGNWIRRKALKQEIINIAGALLEVPQKHMPELRREVRRGERFFVSIVVALVATAVVLVGVVVYQSRQQAAERRHQEAAAGRLARKTRDQQRMLAVLGAKDPMERFAQLLAVEEPNEEPDWRQRALDVLRFPAPIAYLEGESSGVRGVAFGLVDDQVATAEESGRIVLWEVRTRRPRVLGRHEGSAQRIVFDPRGRFVASGGQDGVRIWPLEGASQFVRAHSSEVLSLKISGNGAVLLSGAGDGRAVAYWRDRGWKPQVLSHGDTLGNFVEQLAIDYHGRVAATASKKDFRVWKLEAEASEKLGHFEHEITAIAISPDGTRVAAGTENGDIQILELGGVAKLIESQQEASIKCMEFSQRGDALAMGYGNGVSYVLRSPDYTPHVWGITSDDGILYAITFSPDAAWLAAGSGAHRAKLWPSRAEDVTDPQLLGDHTGRVWDLAFNRSGTLLATASDADPRLILWSTRRPLVRTLVVDEVPKAVTFDRAAKTVAVTSESGSVTLWRDGRDQVTLGGYPNTRDAELAIDYDGRFIAVTLPGNGLQVWDATNPITPRVVDTEAMKACPTPEGMLIARRDGSIAIRVSLDIAANEVAPAWEPSVGRPDRAYCGPAGGVVWETHGILRAWTHGQGLAPVPCQLTRNESIKQIAWPRNATEVVAWTTDGALARWDVGSGNARWLVSPSQQETEHVRAFAAAATGTVAYSKGRTELASAVTIEYPDGRRSEKSFDGDIRAMAFTRNSRWLLVADYSHRIFAVDLMDGERQLRVEFHAGPIEGLSPAGEDGFVSWSQDRTLLLFPELTTEALRNALLTAAQIPEG